MALIFYEPVRDERYFERGRRYSEVDWNDFGQIVDAFRKKIDGWYIDPIKSLLSHADSGHFVFSVMGMTCLLIDMLSQYEQGVEEGSSSIFKSFVNNHLPSYQQPLPSSIDSYRPPYSASSSVRSEQLTDVAGVLYTGFRCGILHQAHAPLYCLINPGLKVPEFEPNDHAKYGRDATSSTPGADCLVVVVYPQHLFKEVMGYWSQYTKNLSAKKSSYDTLRDNFKNKFANSFGIDISGASLCLVCPTVTGRDHGRRSGTHGDCDEYAAKNIQKSRRSGNRSAAFLSV